MNVSRALIDQAKDAFWLARGEYRTFSAWVEDALRRHIDATKAAHDVATLPPRPGGGSGPGGVDRCGTLVHPELLPGRVRQAEFWAEAGRALVAEKAGDKAVGVLVHAEQLAPQRIRHDVLVREVIRWCLRYSLSCRDAGELLAERGITVDYVTIYRWVQWFSPPTD